MKPTLVTLAAALLIPAQSQAFVACWYQHIGFRSGQTFTATADGEVLGDFHRLDFQKPSNVHAVWKDGMNLVYDISAIIDITAGVCKVDLKVYDQLTKATIASTTKYGDTCDQGFHLTMRALYPIEKILPQVRKRVGTKQPIFTGVQFGCQAL